jgi:hypothetical protein
MPPDAGWKCSWPKNDPTGYTPFRDQSAVTVQATDQSIEISLGAFGSVTMPILAAVPEWMWNSETWRFTNTLHYDSYSNYPVGDRAVAWALDAAINTPQESMSINPNYWLRTHFYGKGSSVFSVDNQLNDINSLTHITMSNDDPEGIGSLDQLYNGLCQSPSMYLSCASSRIPWISGKGGSCYRSNANSVFPIISPLNDIAMRVMEGAVYVLVTQTAARVKGKNAYTYGDKQHIYFIKRMQNTMGATHDGDLTDINDVLSNSLSNLYNSDMTWNFNVIDVETGEGSWSTIYTEYLNFKWSTGSITRKHISFLEHSDGSREMIRGYVAYDPIDSRVFNQ